ncbi:MAG: protein kinase, partial [Gemmatimonadaceae bacterium]
MAIERTHDAFPEYAPPRDAMVDEKDQAQPVDPSDEEAANQALDLEDEYEILNEIGRGGSAVVFRARDRALKREVAIKLVRTRMAGTNDDAIERIHREARTVANLEHANIVRVHTVRKLRDGSVALIMQLVPGRTLKQAIVEDGPFSVAKAEGVILNVAQALAYAHARGVVHRDVKPENIFLHADTGEALLSDFGIAHSTEYDSRLTMTGAAIGTPAYMSPEQIDGAITTPRSDIYSLGLVAWEMLTGERPWEGETLYNVISKQKHEELLTIEAMRPGLKRPLQYIIERMLQKKPAARWASAENLIAMLTMWIPPSDYQQWEAMHQRQLNLVKAASKGKAPTPTNTPTASSLATVRFPRPNSEQVVIPPSMQQRVTPAGAEVVAEDLDDDTPSWGAEPEPKKSNWRIVASVVALIAIIAGTGTGYALRTGRIALPPAIAQTFGISIKQPTVAKQKPLATDSLGARKPDSVALDTTALVEARLAAGLSANGTPIAGGAPLTATGAVDKPPAATVNVISPGGVAVAANAQRLPVAASVPLSVKPSVPDPIIGTARATDDRGIVAAGGRHSCVLNAARVFCWGANDRGQLGDGELEARDTPSAIVGDLEFAQVSAGRAHSCGVTRGGDAYCWGSDERGQLGDATTTSRSAPVRVAGNLSFQLVKAGVDHTCGLTTGGEIACWGLNTNGQLGDGT